MSVIKRLRRVLQRRPIGPASIEPAIRILGNPIGEEIDFPLVRDEHHPLAEPGGIMAVLLRVTDHDAPMKFWRIGEILASATKPGRELRHSIVEWCLDAAAGGGIVAVDLLGASVWWSIHQSPLSGLLPYSAGIPKEPGPGGANPRCPNGTSGSGELLRNDPRCAPTLVQVPGGPRTTSHGDGARGGRASATVASYPLRGARSPGRRGPRRAPYALGAWHLPERAAP